MEQRGTIDRLESGRIWVALDEADQGEMPAAACCRPDAIVVEARNPSGLELSPGDRVGISSALGASLRTTLLMLGVPLAGFMISYIFAQTMFGELDESIHLLVGFAGLLAGTLVPVIYFRLRKRIQDYPSIVQKLQED